MAGSGGRTLSERFAWLVSGPLGKARALARRLLDLVPLTPLGLVVALGGAYVLFWIAQPERDDVLFVIGGSALGMVALAIVAVTLSALRIFFALRQIARRPDVGRERSLETARSLPTGFSVPGLFFVPLVQVGWEWVEPGARLEVRRRFLHLEEDAELLERGHYRGVKRRVVIGDALGLARIGLRHHDPVELDVLPHAGALRQMPLLVSMAGGDDIPHPMGLDDGDRVDLRRYVPGDPARFIHWKVFSRTRKLVVRVPERALTRARRTVTYLVAGRADEASAAAARVAVESGVFGQEWVFGADGTRGQAKDIAASLERIVASASAKEAGALALRSFVDEAERSGPASLLLFVPARPGPWIDRVVAVLRGRPGRARVVIGTDGVDTVPPRPWWRRLISAEPPRTGTPASELDDVVRALSATRCEVVVVDRSSGRKLGDAHRAAMRAMSGAPQRAA